MQYVIIPETLQAKTPEEEVLEHGPYDNWNDCPYGDCDICPFGFGWRGNNSCLGQEDFVGF